MWNGQDPILGHRGRHKSCIMYSSQTSRRDVIETRLAVAIQPGLRKLSRSLFREIRMSLSSRITHPVSGDELGVRGWRIGHREEGGEGKKIAQVLRSSCYFRKCGKSGSHSLARRYRGSRNSKRCTDHKVRTGQIM